MAHQEKLYKDPEKTVDKKHVLNRHILIGGSAGGLDAAKTIISGLDQDIKASVFLILHWGTMGVNSIKENLAKQTKLPVVLAENEVFPKPGTIYIAPPDYHCHFVDDRISIRKGPRVNRVRPAIDISFRSAAVAYNTRVIGIILSGMLDDGVAGLQAIKKCGGTCIIQSPDDAEYSSMPENALYRVESDYVLRHEAIADVLNQLTEVEVSSNADVPLHIRIENQLDMKLSDDTSQMDKLGSQVPINCPDCGGPLWEIKEKNNLRYRCHVGHTITAQSLITGKNDQLEKSLWIAYRTLEEKLRMLETMSKHEKEAGHNNISISYQNKAEETREHAERLKHFVFSINKEN